MRRPEKFIWISSAPGAHGKFLQSLMFWLSNDIVPTEKFKTIINYHDQGASVQGYTNVGRTGTLPIKSISDVTFNGDNGCSTMVFAGGMELFHDRTDYKDIIDSFGRFKWITVTMEEPDWLSIDLNHYFKLDRKLYTRFIPDTGRLKFKDPTVAVDIIKQCYALPKFTDRRKEFSLESYQRQLQHFDIGYRSVFDYLEFRDILSRPEYVMSKMSEWCERPVSDFIRTTYLRYVESQRAFLSKINPSHFLVAESGQLN